MVFAAPWLLLALPALPLLWWLLRATPPAPRTETFPAIRLLAGLRPHEETPARTPWWLLALRMLAAALIIVGLARPVLDPHDGPPGSGPVLLVIDDGWAAAADWPARLRAAEATLDRAERSGRQAALLTTADGEDAAPPRIGPVMPAAELRPVVAALRPKPWPVDRAGAATALAAWRSPGGAVAYIADGLAAADDPRYAATLRGTGPVTELLAASPAVRLLRAPRIEPHRLVARVSTLPAPVPTEAAVLAQSGDGRTLARAVIPLGAGATGGEAPVALPAELRNRLSRLVLEGPATAGAVVLLDEAARRRPVGLLTAGENADAPLTGSLYYVRRALAPTSELRAGDLRTLLARDISVIVVADRPLAGEEAALLSAWVEKGGLLLRFSGPRTAEASSAAAPDAAGAAQDALLPVRLLAGDRQLGGALSWSQPARLAPFPPGTPFSGLAVPAEVTVTRQVLAEPSAELAGQTWARLADGTPLVTAATRGAGRIVLFHVTANTEWSNLPLSGLFVDMLRRLAQLSAGVAPAEGATPLAPAETLDGFGALGQPPRAATALAADRFAATTPSPRHPPGLYGPETGRQALNLGSGMPPLAAAAPVGGATLETLGGLSRERALGPWLLGAALALLAVDLVLALRLRGLLGGALRPGAAALLILLAALPARADDPSPALATRLAYVLTGDAQVDGISRAGLAGLSDYVNRRTAASLAAPAAVTPGRDDLSFYPLIYWPVTDGAAGGPAWVAALNDYMNHGGIVLIDTRNGGSGEGFAPGTDEALRRAAQGLEIPPLAPLTTEHVLARAFYLLRDFPGRYDGDTVWVQRDQDRANDSVSPVIIGGHDWAAAWAVDADGQNPYATIPGGARQRTLAYRFGVNVVMYALTGNYKGDQVHVPDILERLGQ